ncbi:hypothetical protein [Chitinimonas sp. BJB300]|uniref:hypothetical protein n=2 Tax=Chitinimonas sp. BJB300 TaxID=1559339 RepID=UPI0035B56EAE
MASCAGAHHWARLLQSRGFTVKLMAPQFVKPYVKSNKNDANDAEGGKRLICNGLGRMQGRLRDAARPGFVRENHWR